MLCRAKLGMVTVVKCRYVQKLPKSLFEHHLNEQNIWFDLKFTLQWVGN